jgi:hypothetical protein
VLWGLLLGRLFLVFLFAFEFHNCVVFVVCKEPHGSLTVLIIRIFIYCVCLVCCLYYYIVCSDS